MSDGPWQVGAKSAYEYGRLANEASKVMKLVDDSIETILVGSSTPRLPSYPEWDRIALEEAYENVDYLALHNYIDKYDEEDLTKPPKMSVMIQRHTLQKLIDSIVKLKKSLLLVIM